MPRRLRSGVIDSDFANVFAPFSAAILAPCRAERAGPTQPSAMPLSVRRWSALSARKRQPILRARGEHPIGLGDSPRHQVVDHHSEIAVGAIEHDSLRRRWQPMLH